MKDKRGGCVAAAILLCPKLDDIDDWIVEGYVVFGNRKYEHTWVLVKDEIVDPTFAQFRKFKNFPEANREVRAAWPPSVFLKMAKDNWTFWGQVVMQYFPRMSL